MKQFKSKSRSFLIGCICLSFSSCAAPNGDPYVSIKSKLSGKTLRFVKPRNWSAAFFAIAHGNAVSIAPEKGLIPTVESGQTIGITLYSNDDVLIFEPQNPDEIANSIFAGVQNKEDEAAKFKKLPPIAVPVLGILRIYRISGPLFGDRIFAYAPLGRYGFRNCGWLFDLRIEDYRERKIPDSLVESYEGVFEQVLKSIEIK